MSDAYRPCAIIPCYNHGATIRHVASAIREHLADVFIVNDGSDASTTEAIEALGTQGFHVVHRDQNGGKGAAVKSGFEAAHHAGFTHALQIDADGQHDLGRIEQFLEISREQPRALVLGHPRFDESAPLGRRLGRRITQFWTHVETLGRKIVDPMCGFRVYPIGAALVADARGDHMDFDIEIAVKMVRRGVPVHNVEVPVRYLSAAEGGLSNFRMFRDNVAISVVHTRLVFSLIPWLLWHRPKRKLLE